MSLRKQKGLQQAHGTLFRRFRPAEFRRPDCRRAGHISLKSLNFPFPDRLRHRQTPRRGAAAIKAPCAPTERNRPPTLEMGRQNTHPGALIPDFDPDTTEQADLRGGHSPWSSGPARPARPALTADLACDALIVGGGITGALMAEQLTRQGLDTVVIDRELPGRGSTAASTSMLLWEIDRSLQEQTDLYGLVAGAIGAHRALEPGESCPLLQGARALP
eukprot:gene12723-16950_t